MKKGRIGLLVLVVIGLLISGCVGGVAAPASTEKSTITVVGNGKASGTPDMATVQLGVSIIQADLAGAIQESNRTMTRITAALVALGVEEKDLQTANFNVWPEMRYDRETGEATGEVVYHVENSLSVTVRNLELLSAVLNGGLDAGANSVNGITFGLLEQDALVEEARTLAIAEAKERAALLAAGFDATLGDPFSIIEMVGGGMPAPMAMMEAAAARDVPISVGELSVSVQVQVTYLLIP